MVCIPMGRGQNVTAARILYHGAGIRSSSKASVARIRKTVQSVLGQDRYGSAAARLVAAVSDEPTTDLVSELESAAGSTAADVATAGRSAT
jgi:UDP:flavonoid glycosyltransferase YjiC (YdhE family)